MKKKKLTKEQLEKEIILLKNGYYDTEVNEFIQNKIINIREKDPKINGLACFHGSCACIECCRWSWFKYRFKW